MLIVVTQPCQISCTVLAHTGTVSPTLTYNDEVIGIGRNRHLRFRGDRVFLYGAGQLDRTTGN